MIQPDEIMDVLTDKPKLQRAKYTPESKIYVPPLGREVANYR